MKFKNYNIFSETGSVVPSSNSSMKGGRTFKDYNDFSQPQINHNFLIQEIKENYNLKIITISVI